jgi:hypothetical protein
MGARRQGLHSRFFSLSEDSRGVWHVFDREARRECCSYGNEVSALEAVVEHLTMRLEHA